MQLGIFCAGSLGKETFDLINQGEVLNRWEDVFFIDDITQDSEVYGRKVLKFDDVQKNFSPDDLEIIIATGEPQVRERLYTQISDCGYNLATIICKTAYIGGNAIVSKGCIVFPFVYIGNHTEIDENTVLHVGCKVESKCIVGKHGFISLGAFVGADTVIGQKVFVGPNAVLRDHIEIKNKAVIGMGSVVTGIVDVAAVVVGNPAKVIRENITGNVFKTTILEK